MNTTTATHTYEATAVSRRAHKTYRVEAADQRAAHKMVRELAREELDEFWFNGRVSGGLRGVRRVAGK